MFYLTVATSTACHLMMPLPPAPSYCKFLRLTCMGIVFQAFVLPLSAQVDWHAVDSLYSPLPAGIQVYRTTTPLDGKANIAYYVRINLRDKALGHTVNVVPGKRLTPAEYYKQNSQPLVVVNGTFFSFADNRNLNLAMAGGRLLAYNQPVQRQAGDSTRYHYLTRSAIGISRRGRPDVAWLYTDTARRYPVALTNGPPQIKGPLADPSWKDLKKAGQGISGRKWKMHTAIGGGPVLVQDGKARLYHKEERMFANGENDRHPRTAMGYTADGHLIILAVEGRHPGVAEGASLHHLAAMLVQLQCVEALNLDGGGSSCLLVNGRETIRPSDKEGQRPVPAVWMVYTQK